jgi:hypothetical protein
MKVNDKAVPNGRPFAHKELDFQQRRRALAEASLKVRGESMRVNAEFDIVEDILDTGSHVETVRSIF